MLVRVVVPAEEMARASHAHGAGQRRSRGSRAGTFCASLKGVVIGDMRAAEALVDAERREERDRTSMALSLRNGILQRRVSCRAFFAASLLIAGVKLTKYFPHRFFDRRERNVYSRKLNFSLACSTRRPSSLQQTIFVFSGCTSRQHRSKRRLMLFITCCALSLVLQCATISSAYLSNSTYECVSRIQLSNARCRNIMARRGLATFP